MSGKDKKNRKEMSGKNKSEMNEINQTRVSERIKRITKDKIKRLKNEKIKKKVSKFPRSWTRNSINSMLIVENTQGSLFFVETKNESLKKHLKKKKKEEMLQKMIPQPMVDPQ